MKRIKIPPALALFVIAPVFGELFSALRARAGCPLGQGWPSLFLLLIWLAGRVIRQRVAADTRMQV